MVRSHPDALSGSVTIFTDLFLTHVSGSKRSGMADTEVVVLVNEQNHELGTAPKASVHTSDTPLHRGFSLFLFNLNGDLLLTQRAKSKKAFPGYWTNTVCGHPAPGERVTEAAVRRLEQELGIGIPLDAVKEVAQYRYRFADHNGIVENEICPVMVAKVDATDPKPAPGEVENWKWVTWQSFLDDIIRTPQYFSPWCREEALFVNKHIHMAGYLQFG